MARLDDPLKQHQRPLTDLSREPYEGQHTPEVRTILIKSCMEAIARIRLDLDDPD